MRTSGEVFTTSALKSITYDLDPGGSEIRLLPTMKRVGICQCPLPAGQASAPVSHHLIEEICYVLEEEDEVWRKATGTEEGITVSVSAGTSLTIPPRTSFQFRNIGSDPLCILIATMPPWPGPGEAVKIKGVWCPAACSSSTEPQMTAPNTE